MTRAALGIVVALVLAAPAAAAPELVEVGDFSRPIHVAAPPGDPARVFVVERAGAIRVVRDGTVLPEPFLDVRTAVDTAGERGMLSMAFAPDYQQSGLFYVFLTPPGGDLQVREFRAATPDRADPAGRLVLSVPHGDAANHNGGQLQFAPDGTLWISTGDGGGQGDPGNDAQRLDSQLGKLLRIDPRAANGQPYTVPPGNRQGTVAALGLRNPVRFSFDRQTGDLWLGDVGAAAWEEIDFLPASQLLSGADFGWSCHEGAAPGPQACAPVGPRVDPVHVYANPPDAAAAVVGGYVVRDRGLPTLAGRYLFADTFDGNIRSLPGDRFEALNVPFIVSFGQDACGRIYAVSLNGPVYRLQDGAPGPCVLFPSTGPATGPATAPADPPGPAGAPAPAAGAPAVAAGAPAVADRVAPALILRYARRQRPLGRRGIRLIVRCDEACTVSVRARVGDLAATRRVRLQLAGGARRTVRLRFGRPASAAVRRALARRAPRTARIQVRATDRSGNVRRVARRVVISP